MSNTTLITGANRGIGLELVRQYGEDGWNVFACCRDPENAKELSQITARSGGKVSVHPLDVTDAKQIQAMVAAVGDTPIDILINVAGIYLQKGVPFGDTDESAWLETFRVNTIAPLKMMEAFVDAVAASERKVFANLTSRMGSIGDNTSGGSYVYRSSKAALNAVAKNAAIDLNDRGITVVVLHPGWVQTDMGGPSALITVKQSVTGIRTVLQQISLADSGKFFNFDGSIIPW